MNKSFLRILALCLVVSCGISTAQAKKRKHKRNKHKHCCPKPPPPPVIEPTPFIVGTWLFNEVVEELGSFSVLSADQDGNLTIHRSLSIQQPAPADFPTGNYTSVDKGIWRDITTTRFQVLSTSIVNIVTTGIPEALTGTPFARAQSVLDFTISEDGNSLSYTGTITLYEINDLTFSNPLLNPETGLPFVSNITANGIRLKFSLLDMGP